MRRAWALASALAVGAGLWGAVTLDRWVAAAPVPPLAAPASRMVLDRDGVPLRVVLAADGRWRLPVALSQVDQGYVAQLIAYEDKRFWRHAGVDPLAMLRAGRDNLLAGRVVSGGSTLTMQVARLLTGDRAAPGRWARKRDQIRLALKLERILSKDEILEIYLTRAPFGGNLEGIRAGAMAWFGKDATRLSPAEAALLVALPQAPNARRPDRPGPAPEAARAAVLRRAADAGVIEAAWLPRALAAPLPQARRAMPAEAWHLAGRALDTAPYQAVQRLPLSAGVQAALSALAAEAAARAGPGLSAALIAYDHVEGRLVAQVGAARPGTNRRDGFVDMTRAVRSPGSALKPFVYALAFADGKAHPETRVDDRPTDFGGYAPQNFDGGFQGPVSVRSALQQSLNVPAVATLAAVGPRRLTSFLGAAGAPPRTPAGGAPELSAALGGVGLTLEDLVRLYAILARGGRAEDGRRVLDAVAAWHTTDILRGTRLPGGGADGSVAFKTGTSYGHRDAWALGFDGRFVVGVWVGRPDAGAVPGLTGAGAAAPAMLQAFQRLSARRTPFADPPAHTLTVAWSALPPRLRWLSGPGAGSALRLSYPPEGARIALGAAGDAAHLVAKIEAGRPPFTWLIDGRVVAANQTARRLVHPLDRAGYLNLTVLDAAGASARRSLEVVAER